MTHTQKNADGDNGRERVKDHASPQQKCPESAKQQHFQSFQSLGKDRETGPCRNNTVKNGEKSSAKTRILFANQHFSCRFQFGTFGLTTYLPTDRKIGPPGNYVPGGP